MTLIRGSGGSGKSGGSSHTPVEAPDSLHSISTARILDLVSEGQIQGFKHGPDKALQDIYLNETRIQNADGTVNFKNVQVDSRVGLQTQDPIPGFPSVENETAVGVALIYGTPWVQAFSDLTLSAVRVRLGVPTLTSTSTTNGDISGTSVGYTIELSTDGGAYVLLLTGTFNGKTTTEYDRLHRIDLPKATTGWSVRVSRTTVTSTSVALVNAFNIVSYTTVVDGKFSYPNSAIVAVAIDAAQFQKIPTRTYDLLGRIIRVPSNYNPTTRTYNGVWDGTFQSLWSDNPAWIYFDLATNNRYGLGALLADTQVDKWGLYTIGQYCDGFVSTGLPARAVVTTGSVTLSCAATGSAKSVTGAFATGIFTATAHGYAAGDSVQFSNMAGGAGIVSGTVYYVIATNLAANTFMVSATVGGASIAYTTDLNLGAVTKAGSYSRTTGSFVTDGFLVGDEVNATGFATAGNNGRGVVLAVQPLALTLTTAHTLTADVAAAARTLALQGPTEPRFTCNVYLQTQADAYKVMQDLASTFRGISYWSGGLISAASDAPANPVYTYTNANVIGGKFTYQGSGRKTRHTVALVDWNDPSDFDRLKTEYVSDDVGIARYGVQSTKVVAVGCRSQGQARRFGSYTLLSERLETNTCSFAIGLDGVFASPGQIIQIADASRAGRRIGGRISGNASTATAIVTEASVPIVTELGDGIVTEGVGVPNTTTQFTIDASPSVAIVAGNTIIINMPSGLSASTAVSAVSGNLITVSPALPFAPAAGAVWAVETASLVTQRFRVLSVTDNGDLTFTVTALSNNASKYAAVETGSLIQIPSTSALPSQTVSPVASVTLSTFQRAGSFDSYTVLEATWPFVTGAVAYAVQWSKDGATWSSPARIGTNIATYESPFPGSYRAMVSSLGPNNQQSIPVTSAAYTVDVVSLPPISDSAIAVSIVAGVATVNCSIGNHFTIALNANATLAFKGIPNADHIRIEVTQVGGAHTLAMPASVVPVTGVNYIASTTAGAVDLLDLSTFNAGGAWRLTYTKASAFAVTASPSPASATANSVSGANVSPSVVVTATPTGGTGTVTHAWARSDSGSGNFAVSSTTAAAPTFSIPSTHTVQSVTQQWRDTCTDSSVPPNVTSVVVPITLSVTSSGSPPLTQVISPDVSSAYTVGHTWSQVMASTLSGGTGVGQTWAWSYVSGSTVFSLVGASTQYPTLSIPTHSYGTFTASYQCVANDSGASPVTTAFTVSVELSNGL